MIYMKSTIYMSRKLYYVGKAKQNVEIQWEEHSDINTVSEPSRHLQSNPMHVFPWRASMAAPINYCVRKNLLMYSA